MVARCAPIDAASCAEVIWARDMLTMYPRIGEACQQVLISEGVRWVRFDTALVGRDYYGGTATLDVRNRYGVTIEQNTVKPRGRQEGRSLRLSELIRGQQLNVYVLESVFAALGEPTE